MNVNLHLVVVGLLPSKNATWM